MKGSCKTNFSKKKKKRAKATRSISGTYFFWGILRRLRRRCRLPLPIAARCFWQTTSLLFGHRSTTLDRSLSVLILNLILVLTFFIFFKFFQATVFSFSFGYYISHNTHARDFFSLSTANQLLTRLGKKKKGKVLDIFFWFLIIVCITCKTSRKQSINTGQSLILKKVKTLQNFTT